MVVLHVVFREEEFVGDLGSRSNCGGINSSRSGDYISIINLD